MAPPFLASALDEDNQGHILAALLTSEPVSTLCNTEKKLMFMPGIESLPLAYLLSYLDFQEDFFQVAIEFKPLKPGGYYVYHLF
jgi:hypothetical protein